MTNECNVIVLLHVSANIRTSDILYHWPIELSSWSSGR